MNFSINRNGTGTETDPGFGCWCWSLKGDVKANMTVGGMDDVKEVVGEWKNAN